MTATRRLLLISNSTQHGSGYLEHCASRVKEFFTGCNHILFVPYALADMDTYAATATKAFEEMGFKMTSIHQYENPQEAVKQVDGVFIGGGNTFRLLNKLYVNNLISVIRKRVLEEGMPYMGTSAGSNVATWSIKTTNDMPIVYPPSFDALQLVNFQINAHFIDAQANSTHMGETREKRLQEFHEENDTTVIGLREGAMLHIEGDRMALQGQHGGKLFVKGEAPQEIEIDQDLSQHLL